MYFSKIKSLTLLLITLSSTVTIFSCKDKTNVEQTNIIQKVSIVSPVSDTASDALESFGTITYKSKNDVTCLQSGQLIYFPLEEGAFVQKGQIIARLKNVQLELQKEQYENALETAKASLAVAKNALREERLSIESRLIQLEKQELNIKQKNLELIHQKEILKGRTELHDIGGITDIALQELELQGKSLETEIEILQKENEISRLGLRDKDLLDAGYSIPENYAAKKELLILLNTKNIISKIEAAEAEVKNAQTSLMSINKLLDELIIRSPITGVIATKDFTLGEYIEQNKRLATIIDISSVYAIIYIQEKDMVHYQEKDKIKLTIPSLDTTVESVLENISPVADPTSGNFSIRAEIKNKDQRIRPGMFVKCTLKGKETKEYKKLPESVLASKDGNMGTIFCVSKNFAISKRISIEIQQGGFIWILNGIELDDIVINNPSPFIKEGMRVQW